MAFASKFVHVILMVLFCLALTQQASEWNCGHGCFYAKAAAQVIPNRKVLYGMSGKEMVVSKSSSVHGPINNKYGHVGGLEDWELRGVPSGPDPLHHHGGSPEKPRTP